MSARVATLCLAAAMVLAPAVSRAQGRGVRVGPGLRYLRRVVRHGERRATAHALFVDLCQRGLALRATAPDEGRLRVSTWARRVGALAAINGDYFDLRTGTPLGPARGAGRWWPEVPWEHRDALFVADAEGRVDILDASDLDAARWRDARARVPARWTEVVAVRERVLVDGVVRESATIRGRDRRHPRTALGLSADRRTLILLVVEGRSEENSGVTARELGEMLLGLGARDGMKLDGGGSSTMFLSRRGLVNHPSDGRERAVATHLGVVLTRDASPRCR